MGEWLAAIGCLAAITATIVSTLAFIRSGKKENNEELQKNLQRSIKYEIIDANEKLLEKLKVQFLDAGIFAYEKRAFDHKIDSIGVCAKEAGLVADRALKVAEGKEHLSHRNTAHIGMIINMLLMGKLSTDELRRIQRENDDSQREHSLP